MSVTCLLFGHRWTDWYPIAFRNGRPVERERVCFRFLCFAKQVRGTTFTEIVQYATSKGESKQ